jgi:hypothetical protein
MTKYGQLFVPVSRREASRRSTHEWLVRAHSLRQEKNDVKHFLMLGGLLMAASLIAPVAVSADDNNNRDKRYYDRDGKDYHTWNGDEDRQYRAYLVEQHRVYVPFVKVKVRQQREYFKYRHEHGFKIEVR